jgi:hypothetical protein
MNAITIYIDWPYFLGIIGTLIATSYYANGRFTKIETTIDWLKDTLQEIKTRLEGDAERRRARKTGRRFRTGRVKLLP